jgi:hypothetical protein
MALPLHQRYEIVFLSQHSLGPKLSYAAVTIVKYWLKRWKQSKDLTDSNRTGRPRVTTQK